MNKFRSILALILTLVLLMAPLASFAASSGEAAYEHVRVFSEYYPKRLAGTTAETTAAEYIAQQFADMGYDAQRQPFTYVRRGTEYTSQNIIAVKPGSTGREVIVGAHYDSVSTGEGVDDNGSGVAVLLEIAERLSRVNTSHTVRFIAFGAEESGLHGSRHYADSMTSAQVENTAAMINLDTLLAGDYMYVYSALSGDGWVRDQALQIASSLGLNLQTNPGLNPSYPAGETGDWSDHAPFRKLGIPVAYFEATNWTIGELDGYDQTVAYGPIMHTQRDSLAFIEEAFPGRAREHMHTFTSVLYHLLLQLSEPSQVQRIVKQGATVEKNIWQAGATIPFKFTTIGEDGVGKPMENVTLRVFDREREVAAYSGDQVRMLGKKGQYMVNIDTRRLGLEEGLYLVLIEYVSEGKPVVFSGFLTLK